MLAHAGPGSGRALFFFSGSGVLLDESAGCSFATFFVWLIPQVTYFGASMAGDGDAMPQGLIPANLASPNFCVTLDWCSAVWCTMRCSGLESCAPVVSGGCCISLVWVWLRDVAGGGGSRPRARYTCCCSSPVRLGVGAWVLRVLRVVGAGEAGWWVWGTRSHT